MILGDDGGNDGNDSADIDVNGTQLTSRTDVHHDLIELHLPPLHQRIIGHLQSIGYL